MPRVLEAVRGNAIFKVLDSKLVSWRPLVMDRMTEIASPTGLPGGLSARAFPVPSKVALWREDPEMKDFGSTAEDTVGLELTANNGSQSQLLATVLVTDRMLRHWIGECGIFISVSGKTDKEMR
jgi:hypothetical protein